MKTWEANAKINLCLNVVGRSADGYHELSMIVVPLALHDTLLWEPAAADCFSCDDPTLAMDASNTLVKAAQLMRKTFKLREHFHVQLIKRIPMQAGLAGGSADAAALMRGLWEHYSLPCSLAELALLGKQIGADVPFCIYNTCASVKGIGEEVAPFENHCDFGVLLVKPRQGVSTKAAFQTLNLDACPHPNADQCRSALMSGAFPRFCGLAQNSLETSAFALVPEVAQIKQELLTDHFPLVLMSGSGSTVFALSPDREQLAMAQREMAKRYPFAVVSELLEKSLPL